MKSLSTIINRLEELGYPSTAETIADIKNLEPRDRKNIVDDILESQELGDFNSEEEAEKTVLEATKLVLQAFRYIYQGFSFIQDAYNEHTGGGCMADTIVLDSGRVIVISDELIGIYADMNQWQEGQGDCLRMIDRADLEEEANPKNYLCHWGEGYAHKENRQEPLKFFSESNGYSQEHISKIKALEVAESANLSDPSGTHIVTRIK